jgi:hypothetical protein
MFKEQPQMKTRDKWNSTPKKLAENYCAVVVDAVVMLSKNKQDEQSPQKNNQSNLGLF